MAKKKETVEDAFTILVSSHDRSMIDFATSAILGALNGTGAKVKGPELLKNAKKNGQVLHKRQIVVTAPTDETHEALGKLNIPGDVDIRVFQDNRPEVIEEIAIDKNGEEIIE